VQISETGSDFAAEIEQQRARLAAAAKDLGIVPTQ
jgi:hypothetical protein